MAANRIYIQVDFQSSQADAQVAALNRNLANIGPTAAKSTAQAAAGAKGFSVAIEQSSRAADQLTSALAGLAAVRVGATMFEATDQIKKAEIAIATITKSSEAAAQVMKEIRQIAKTQPFRFTELAEMAQRLAGFGFEAREIPKIVEQISDAAAALGKGKIGIDSITLALGQMRTKGLAQGQELFRQLGEAGIQITKYLAPAVATALNITVEEAGLKLRKLSEAGQVAGKKAAQLILQGMGEEFGGSGARMAQLVTAQFAKIQDDMVEIGETIAALVLPPLQKIINLVRDMLQWFNKLPPVIQSLAIGMIALTTAITAFSAIFTFIQAQAGIQLMISLVAKLTLGMEALAIASVAAFEVRSLAPFTLLMAQLIPNLDKILLLLRNIGAVTVVIGLAFNALNVSVMKRELEDVEKTVMDAIDRLKKERASAMNTAEENLIIANTELLKHQMDIAEAALNAATAALEGGLAAIAIKFRGLMAEVAGNAGATAKVLQALQIRMLTFAKEWTQASLDIVNATAKMRLETQAAATARWMELQITALDHLGQITIESTKAIEEKRLAIQMDTANKIRQNRLDLIKDAYDEEARKVRQRITDEAPYLNPTQLDELNRQVQERLEVLDRKYLQDREAVTKATEDEIARYILDSRQRVNEAIARDFEEEFERLNRKVRQGAEMRIAVIEARPARTLEEQIAQEQQLAQIRITASEEILQNNLRLLDIQKQSYEFMLRTIFTGNTLQKYLEESKKRFTRDETTIRNEAVDEQAKYRLSVEKKVNDLIYDAQKSAYENLKDQAGRVFDALLQKTTSVWQAIANIFKTTILTAIRDIVTSHVAKMLFQLFNPGQTVTVGAYGQPTFGGTQRTGGGGPVTLWDRFKRAIGGIVPSYAPTSAITPPYVAPSGGGTAANPYRQTLDNMMKSLGLGGTGGALTGTGSANREMADLYNLPTRTSAGTASMWSLISGARGPSTMTQIRESFNIGKPIRLANGNTVAWTAASPAAKLGSVLRSSGFGAMAAAVGVPVAMAGLKASGAWSEIMTVGGAALAGFGLAGMIGLPGPAGAALGAGIGLFAAGIRRGGALGMLETTAGGALAGAMIGARFGGFVGAGVGLAVGAAVGLTAGTIRLFVKTADEKLREKIKSVYGIDVSERNIRLQIMEIIKNSYGGNIDVGIRSKQVMDLVQLYAMASGQSARNMIRPMYPATFAQSGAGLQMQPVYSGGSLVSSPYSGPTTIQPSLPQGVYIQLDPRQAGELFEGRVVNVMQSNPGVVAESNANATRAGTSRVAQRGNMMEPLTVMS